MHLTRHLHGYVVIQLVFDPSYARTLCSLVDVDVVGGT